MARPLKRTVEYFPHMAKSGRTMYIVESKYGNNGYAFWFKLLELLSDSEGQVYDTNDPANWEFLLAKTRVEESMAQDILTTLASVGAIDAELWTEHRIVWSQNLVERLAPLYNKRNTEKPERPFSNTDNPTMSEFSERKPDKSNVFEEKTTQSKVKESKVKKSKENVVVEIPDGINSPTSDFEKENKNTYSLKRENETQGKKEESCAKEERFNYDAVLNAYHATCIDFPKIVKLTYTRKSKIRQRVREMGSLDILKQVFEKMQSSEFMKGNNKGGWKATFDWLIDNPNNWLKVLEGNYDNNQTKHNENFNVNEIWTNQQQ